MVVNQDQRSINQEVSTALRHSAARTQKVRIVSASAVPFKLSLNYVLVSHFGMIGAAWATLLGFLAIAVGNGYFSWSGFTATLGLGPLFKVLLVATVLYGVSMAVNLPLGLAILAKGVLLAFFAVIVIARMLSADEAATVSSGVLPGRRGA